MDISATPPTAMTKRETADIDVSRPTLPFASFYRNSAESIARALAVTLDDAELGVDAANEAMIQARRQWTKIAAYDNPATWLFRAGLRRSRSRRQRRRRFGDTGIPGASGALSKLSVDDRAVVVCRIHLGWSVEQTAKSVGIAPEVVNLRWSRSMDHLRGVVELAPVDVDNADEVHQVVPLSVETAISKLVDETVLAAATAVDAELVDRATIDALAERRDRRRRITGGLATMLVVAALTIAVGLDRQGGGLNAVFQGATEPSMTPNTVVRHEDLFVGVATMDGIAIDDDRNVRSVVVKSTDGITWEAIEGSPTLVASSVALGEHDGVVHVVGISHGRGEDAGGAVDGATVVRFRSADLRQWTEQSHPLPNDMLLDGYRFGSIDVGFVAEVAVVLARQWPKQSEEWTAMQALDKNEDVICDMLGTGTRTTIRLCGTSELIDVRHGTTWPYTFDTVLFGIDADSAFPIELPEVEGNTMLTFGPWNSIYQTEDGVGVVNRRNFESTDGLRWEQRDLGGPFGAMMAGRGSDEVYKTPYHVARYGPADPVKAMGFSADGGASWRDIRLDVFFVAAETSPRFFADLTAGEAGWALVAARSLVVPLEVAGFERGGDDDSSFSLEADGFVLEGHMPRGPAVLSDPAGRAVRTWRQLEVANPIWSGLEIYNGDVVAVDEITGRELVTFTAEQWAALTHRGGANTFDVLYSENGSDWTVIDTSSARTRILFITADEMLVQRVPVGNFASSVPPIEVIPLPRSPESQGSIEDD